MFPRLSRSTYNFYIRSSIKKPWIIDGIVYFINLPLLAQIYHCLYYPRILKKISLPQRQITIETYDICNLSCIMCPYPKMTRPKMKMPMSLFQKIVDDAFESGFNEVNLTMYGEPLLDDLLFQRIAYVKKKMMKVGFTSNGVLLTPDKIQGILESGLDWIVFSIDSGTKSLYEHIRIGANFEDTCANIRELIRSRREKNINKPLIVIHSTVLTKDNLHASKLLASILPGVDHFTKTLVDSRRDKNFLFARRSFLKVRKARPYPCPALWGAPAVMSSGKVALCCKDYNCSIELGDLNKQTIREILNFGELEKIRELHLRGEGDKIETCRSCDTLYRANLSWWMGRLVEA